jgi:hypothetical protein
MIILTIAYLCKRFKVLARVYSLMLVAQVPSSILATYFPYQGYNIN